MPWLALLILLGCKPSVPNEHDGHEAMPPALQKSQLADEEINLSLQQILLGNIHTDTLRAGSFSSPGIFTAKLSADPTRICSFSARLMGHIEKLYVKTLGRNRPPRR